MSIDLDKFNKQVVGNLPRLLSLAHIKLRVGILEAPFRHGRHAQAAFCLCLGAQETAACQKQSDQSLGAKETRQRIWRTKESRREQRQPEERRRRRVVAPQQQGVVGGEAGRGPVALAASSRDQGRTRSMVRRRLIKSTERHLLH